MSIMMDKIRARIKNAHYDLETHDIVGQMIERVCTGYRYSPAFRTWFTRDFEKEISVEILAQEVQRLVQLRFKVWISD